MKKFTILAFVLLITLSCKKKEQVYQTNLDIKFIKVIKKDKEKKPLVLDVEVTYPDCPGIQIEIIRGNQEFASCMLEKYKVGDKVNGEIRWGWESLGYYKWHIEKVGDCNRWVDPKDEFSYEMIEECDDFIIYGIKEGFLCKRIPTDELIEKCPWFRRE